MRHCLFCHAPFTANRSVEHFDAARRIAYDPARGRLWAVCSACMRWSLAPIQTRWEALEELERLIERGRALGRSENVALFTYADVEIVRIGRAPMREEAWWRYGRTLRERQQKAQRIVRYGRIRDLVVSTALLLPVWLSSDEWINRARYNQFGLVAWNGNGRCMECGNEMQQIDFGDDIALREPGVLRARCMHCEGRGVAGYFELRGTSAQYVLRRVLAYQNFSGASDNDLDHAVGLIDDARGADEFTTRIAGPHALIRRLRPVEKVALEIAVNDAREHELLALELDALEARWKEEEEIAAIIDRELS